MVNDNKDITMLDIIKKRFFALVEQIETLFKKFDQDNSGTLETYELALVSKYLHFEMTEEDIENCKSEIDADGNGSVTFDEFAMWFLSGKLGTPKLNSDEINKQQIYS